MDRLADAFRLIYYDQRGRGKSTWNVPPAPVSLQSEMDDLERVREYFQLEQVAVLGHSWADCWLWNTRCAIRRASPT
jgi:proline iminopeptidase